MTPTATSSILAGLLALVVVLALLRFATPGPRTTAIASDTTRRTTAVPRIAKWIGQAMISARQRRRAGATVPPDAAAIWCDALARRLRSGETLRQVLAEEQPAHAALSARTEVLRRALLRGESVADSIGAIASYSGSTALDLVWSVLAIASGYGGSAAEPIDRAASALRLRSADAHERSAQSAQARLSAHVLTAVPLLVLALLVATDPDVRLIVVRPAGGLLVSAGLVLNLCGWIWMRYVVSSQTA